MEKILLILSTSGYEPEVVEYVLHRAKKESAQLLSCYIIDAEIPETVSSWLIYVGFMGDEPSEDYRNIVLKEYKQRAQETLNEVSKLAEKQNIKVESVILEGSLLDKAVQIAIKCKADLIVIKKPQQFDFGRLLHGSVIEELKKQAPCLVHVVGK